MSKKEIAKLNLVIEQLKAAMSRVSRFISEHESDEMSDILKSHLETRKCILNSNFQKFQETQMHLLYLDPEEVDRSDEFELEYFDILTQINLRLVQGLVSSKCSNQTNACTTSSLNFNNSISTAKLPHIDIPTFDGKNLNNFKPFI